MGKRSQNQETVQEGEEPWWRRQIRLFGIEASALIFIGALIGILICYLWLSKQPFWLEPLIGNAVSATVQAWPTATSAPTYTPYPTSTPYPTPIPHPTYTPYPTPTPVLSFSIDPMETTTGWVQYTDAKGSTVVTGLVDGRTDKAIEVSYTLREWGYVGIVKSLIPCQLFGTRGIRFSYRGTGAPNSLEVKLIYTPDAQGQEAVFSTIRNRATDTNGEWVLFEVSYSEFQCWPDTGCNATDALDISRVQRIDFAISNKQDRGDVAGVGAVLIDEVQAFK